MRRKTYSESPRLRIENGEHSHYLKPPLSKDRRFGNDRTARWISFKTKVKNACGLSTVTLEPKQGMASQVINITTRGNKEISESYEDIDDVLGHSSSAAISSSQKDQDASSDIDKLYAIKTFCSGSNPIDQAHRKRIIAAFDISSSLDHQNIVRVFDLHELSNGSLCETFEHCSGGDLYSLIIASRQLAQTEADCFFKQLMHGIHYIHKMGIAHCDLKPENILLSSRGCLKISNIGIAESFHLGGEGKTTLPNKNRCPNPYVPPELYLGSEFDPKAADIWAAAMIYVAMRTGRIPWKMANDNDECFRDYIIDRMLGRGYFFIEDICNVRHRFPVHSEWCTNSAATGRWPTSHIFNAGY
jgi:serine/threonine protein kinase